MLQRGSLYIHQTFYKIYMLIYELSIFFAFHWYHDYIIISFLMGFFKKTNESIYHQFLIQINIRLIFIYHFVSRHLKFNFSFFYSQGTHYSFNLGYICSTVYIYFEWKYTNKLKIISLTSHNYILSEILMVIFVCT